MPAQNAILQNMAGFGGKNSRDNDFSRPPLFASDCDNFVSQLDEAITVINGHKLSAHGAGGGGLAVYRRIDPSTGETIEELVAIDDDLWRLKRGTLTVTYVTGTALNRTLSIVPSTAGDGTYTLELTEEGVVVDALSFNSGVGAASLYALSTLVTWLGGTHGGVTHFTAVASGGTPAAIAAASLDITPPSFVGAAPSPLVIGYSYWEQIPCPTSTPFATFWASRLTDSFELASLQNCEDQLFVATGYNELYVYDSLGAYRAGMPAATGLAAAAAIAGGSLTVTGTYEWMITYEFLNAVGKTVEGDESNRVTQTMVGASGNYLVPLTIPFVQSAAGFYTHNATISSAAGSPATTVPVTAGHNIVAGDRVVVTNPSTGQGQEAVVVTAAATLLTLDTSVAYSNTAPYNIVSTVRVNIWRNAAGDTELKYLRAQLGNNAGAASVVFNEGLADATLIGYATYDPPAKAHSLPPANLKYLTVYQAGLVGVKKTGDQVYYCDWDGPHYWPEGESSFNLISKQAGAITGIRASREILVTTKAGEIHSAIGDFPNTQYRQELIADAIGCDSHQSIVDVMGSLWYWSKHNGYFKTVSSGVPSDMTYRILPDFTENDGNESARLVGKRAVAVNFPRLQQVFLFVPAESVESVSGERYPNSNSVLFVGDHREQEKLGGDNFAMVKWWPCSGINMGGGAAIYGDQLYFVERRFNQNTSAIEYNLCVRLETKTSYDYHQHALPYPHRYETAWYHGDTPSVLKKWIKTRIYAMGRGVTSGFSTLVQVARDFITGDIGTYKNVGIGVSGSGSGWGYSGWGVDVWGDLDAISSVFDFYPIICKSIKIILSGNTYLEQVRFSGLEVQAVPQYDEDIK